MMLPIVSTHCPQRGHGGSCSTQHERGGPALLNCYSAQVVLPYQLGPTSHGLGTHLKQLARRALTCTGTYMGKLPGCGATAPLVKEAARAQRMACPSYAQ